MFNKIVMFLCLAALFSGIENKPLRRDLSGRSVLKLKLSHDELNKGVLIKITAKPTAWKGKEILHGLLPLIEQPRGRISVRSVNRVRKGRRSNSLKRRQLTKKQSKILKAFAVNHHNDIEKMAHPMKTIEKSVIVPNIRTIRNKRSLPSKASIGNEELNVEDFQKLSDDDENEDAYDDYIEDETNHKRTSNSRREQEQMMREQEHKQQLKMIKSEDYRDYAFDTIDNDPFAEEDDLLRHYYDSKSGHGKQIQSAFHDDYDSFSEFMHAVAEGRRNTRNMNELFYGDDADNVQNVKAEDDESIQEEYDDYYDDDSD